MNSLFILTTCAGLFIAADAPKADPMKKELRKFQGTWIVESFTADGKELAELKGKKITFTGDQMALFGEADRKGTIKIDPSKNPRQIDIQDPENEKKKRQPTPGLYEFNGDTLKLAVADSVEKTAKDGKTGKIIEETFTVGKRPTTFDGKDGIVIVLTREKK